MLCDDECQCFLTQDGEIVRLEAQLQERQDYIREKVATYIYTYTYFTFNLNL